MVIRIYQKFLGPKIITSDIIKNKEIDILLDMDNTFKISKYIKKKLMYQIQSFTVFVLPG